MRVALLTIVVGLFPLAALAQAAELAAPYPIRSSDWAPKNANPSRAVVGFGFREDVARPVTDNFSRMTILGTKGFAHGRLLNVEGFCVSCGGEDEDFYYSGEFALEPSSGDLGRPIAAIPGIHKLTNYKALAMAPLARDQITPNAAFSTGLMSKTDVRIAEWNAETGQMTVEQRFGDETHRFKSERCDTHFTVEFRFIECKGLEDMAMLLHGPQVLLLSVEICQVMDAKPLVRFEFAETTHYVVNFGHDTHEIAGLLHKTERGWLWRSRSAAYYSPC